LRRTMDEAVYLIDSTSVRLSGAGTELDFVQNSLES